MHTLKIRKIGNSAGVVLTGEVLDALGVSVGDHLQLVPSEQGFEVRPYSADLAEEMELAEEFMDKYRPALRELAK
ncbi:MAG: AbrB family transcriptional regulator [Tistlia sp.]|uniref:AbrB/MazE/SpoVT family DNA-binding domain-containing protein n=1 Tax=Tistlia sp. TaxID=3057121 RepID=UPI0034A102E0